MPVSRYLCIFLNVGLGEAAKRDVGTGDNQIPDTSFPLKLVSVLSSGCLPASALSIVVAKFGSFPSAAASSFSVSSAAGAEPTIPAIADFTKAVVAICVLLTDCAAVGAGADDQYQ